MNSIRVMTLAAAMAAGTIWVGWWSVPVLGLLWGLRYRPGGALVAGLLGWSGLLGWQATRAPLADLAARLAGIFGLPAWGVLILGPVIAAGLAWSAAELAAVLRGAGGAAGRR
jgi:hypothetical protein